MIGSGRTDRVYPSDRVKYGARDLHIYGDRARPIGAMTKTSSIDDWWESISPAGQIFEPHDLAALPGAARRYLEHAIAPGTRLASAVRLRMHGEIKLKRWLPFSAEQVIHWQTGMIWRATVRMFGIPIRGFDRLLGGEGEMRWKILGLFPLVNASGTDITRSAAGRVAGETIWLPSVLCREDVTWTEADSTHARAAFKVESERVEVEFTVDAVGRLSSIKYKRWGNPHGDEFNYADFGGFVESEGTFEGYTIPTRLRIGWHAGTARFKPEGEFFRCQIVHAEFR